MTLRQDSLEPTRGAKNSKPQCIGTLSLSSGFLTLGSGNSRKQSCIRLWGWKYPRYLVSIFSHLGDFCWDRTWVTRTPISCTGFCQLASALSYLLSIPSSFFLLTSLTLDCEHCRIPIFVTCPFIPLHPLLCRNVWNSKVILHYNSPRNSSGFLHPSYLMRADSDTVWSYVFLQNYHLTSIYMNAFLQPLGKWILSAWLGGIPHYNMFLALRTFSPWCHCKTHCSYLCALYLRRITIQFDLCGGVVTWMLIYHLLHCTFFVSPKNDVIFSWSEMSPYHPFGASGTGWAAESTPGPAAHTIWALILLVSPVFFNIQPDCISC